MRLGPDNSYPWTRKPSDGQPGIARTDLFEPELLLWLKQSRRNYSAVAKLADDVSARTESQIAQLTAKIGEQANVLSALTVKHDETEQKLETLNKRTEGWEPSYRSIQAELAAVQSNTR